MSGLKRLLAGLLAGFTLLPSACSGGPEEPAPELTAAETAEQSTAEQTTEEITTEVVEMKEITLKIGSYNIKHAADAGLDPAVIGKVIADAGLDIVGLQEVDYFSSRCGDKDQPGLIAKASGLKYYRFVRAIDIKGGQYGTMILSRYPIETCKVTPLESGTYEKRSVGHAVIDVDGVKLDFFNTHLSYEDKAVRSIQFVLLSDMLSECDNYVLTGDFNTGVFSEFEILAAPLMINRDDSRHVSFPGGSSCIDNIVLSDGFEELEAGTVTESYSDHYMLWAKVRFVGPVKTAQP